MIHEANGTWLREEYAVEWHHPDGGRIYSYSCDRRGLADVMLADGPDWPGSRVVKRTVTTSAWEAA